MITRQDKLVSKYYIFQYPVKPVDKSKTNIFMFNTATEWNLNINLLKIERK